MQRTNDYSIPEKKDLEPMVKIVVSEYREMETESICRLKKQMKNLEHWIRLS